jgi:AcrR family transcriptional regulator
MATPDAPAVPRTRRTRLARADRMEQTLTVARTLFADRGYNAVTMDEVAARVGVTKPLLYKYFGNKEHLYIACMERAGDALTATIAAAVAATDGPADALRAGVHSFFDFLDSDRAAWTVLFDETLPRGGQIAERVADYRGQIAELVAGAMLAQVPPARRRAAAAEVEALSATLLGAAEALARWWLRDRSISAPDAANLLIATIEPGLLGVRVEAKPAPPAGKGERS